jgi:hypothetical protein
MDAAPAPADSRAPKDDVELIVLDAVMSFVGHQDYLTAAPQLHHLLNVRACVRAKARRCATCTAFVLFAYSHVVRQAHVEEMESAAPQQRIKTVQWSSHVMFRISSSSAK